MSRRRPLDLQRLRHVDGEMLRSRDFRDEIANDLELHWWHQRAVHQAYGVANGLEVSEPVDGTLSVGPGLAYDARGRELTLLAQTSVELAEGKQPMALVLRCCGAGRGAALAWVPASRVDPCEGVALALLALEASPAFRRLGVRARSVARPRIGWGATPPDATPWELWRPLAGRALSGVQVAIDTRSAGFTDVPCYFAWLQWPGLATAAVEPANYLTLGIQYVQQETIGGFTFRTFLAPRLPVLKFAALRRAAGFETGVAFARTQRLHVCWVGIQCDRDAVTGA
jgi:hypothetical protein